MFSGISLHRNLKKTNKWRNKWKNKQGEKDKNTTPHERAFIVLCIYAIVYVSLWRIWKYMLTNLYRVFYVMWNTWSRCSLVSRALVFVLVMSTVLFFLSFQTTYQKDKLIAHPKPLFERQEEIFGKTCYYCIDGRQRYNVYIWLCMSNY